MTQPTPAPANQPIDKIMAKMASFFAFSQAASLCKVEYEVTKIELVKMPSWTIPDVWLIHYTCTWPTMHTYHHMMTAIEHQNDIWLNTGMTIYEKDKVGCID